MQQLERRPLEEPHQNDEQQMSLLDFTWLDTPEQAGLDVAGTSVAILGPGTSDCTAPGWCGEQLGDDLAKHQERLE